MTPAADTTRLKAIRRAPGESNPDTNFAYFADGGTWERASERAAPELQLAVDLGLVAEPLFDKDMTLPITRAEFAAVVVRVYESLAGVTTTPGVDPFEDTDDVEVLKTFGEDLAVGNSDTEFRPDDLLNREQASTMLTRVVKKMSFEEWTFATDDQFRLEFDDVPALSDDDGISPWAKESFYFMLATGVITDLQDNAFSPRATTDRSEAMDLAGITREQALVLAARMVTRLR